MYFCSVVLLYLACNQILLCDKLTEAVFSCDGGGLL